MNILMLRDIHDGNTWNLAQSPFQILIACTDDIAAMLHCSCDKTVVGIRALVFARDTLKSWIFCNSASAKKRMKLAVTMPHFPPTHAPKRYPILRSEFLKLGHDTVSNTRDAFG